MAVSLNLYNSFLKYVADGSYGSGGLTNPNIKLMLVTDSYTPAPTHDVIADVLSSPSAEVEQVDSPDNGYTTGGKALTGLTVTLTDSPAGSVWDANDVLWSALTATFRYAALYLDETIGGIVSPLIGYIDFGEDKAYTGEDFTVKWPASGIYTFAEAA